MQILSIKEGTKMNIHPIKEGSCGYCATCGKKIEDNICLSFDTDKRGRLRVHHKKCPEVENDKR